MAVMAPPAGWVQERSGLFIPESLLRSHAELAERSERQARGKFFSQMGRAERFNQAGAQEKPADEPSFRFLRDMYYESVLDQIIVMRRQQQVRALCKRVRARDAEVGWQVVHVDHDRPDFQESEDVKRRCAEMEEILENGPTPEVHPGGLADLLTSAVEEELVIDRKAAVVFRDRGGQPRQFHMVDGATVKPIVRVLYEWIEENRQEGNPWGPDLWDVAAVSLSREVGYDLTRAAYVQEVDGNIVAAWTADELCIDTTFPAVEVNRLSFGRGSCFQRSMTLADLAISMTDYNRGLFNVDYPENALILFGDYNPAGLEAFTRQMTSSVGSRNWSRLAVIAADPEFKAQLQKLRDTPRDMLYDRLFQLAIALKTAAYGMHPSEINAQGYESEAPALNQPNEEKQIAYAKEEGLHGLLQHQADWINRFLVRPRYPDLRMVWHTEVDTERERVEINTQRTQTYGTINEARIAENRKPLKHPWADMPTPQALVYAQADAQAQQMQQTQELFGTGQGAGPQEGNEESEAGRQAQRPARPGPGGTAAERPGRSGPDETVPGETRTPKKTGSPLNKSAVRRLYGYRGPRLDLGSRKRVEFPDGRVAMRIRGRVYVLEQGPWGGTWRGMGGGVVLHDQDGWRNEDAAVSALEDWLQGLGGLTRSWGPLRLDA